MNKLYFEATADTFWGCRLDIKTIEQAKQREDFHTKQILGTLTGFNILGWLVKVVSLLKFGGSLLINPKTLKDVSPQCHKGLLLVRKTLAEKDVAMPSLKVTKHDRFGIFRSSLKMVMSGILKDDNYLYYKYGPFVGMEDKRLSHHYSRHSDLIMYSLSAQEHSLPNFLKKLKKTIKTCEHWVLYKYLTCAMCKRGNDRMDPFTMDFDEEENIEMTDDDDFTDMTPEYMFQKFELVLFLLADKTAYLGPMSQLKLQDKLDISDDSIFNKS